MLRFFFVIFSCFHFNPKMERFQWNFMCKVFLQCQSTPHGRNQICDPNLIWKLRMEIFIIDSEWFGSRWFSHTYEHSSFNNGYTYHSKHTLTPNIGALLLLLNAVVIDSMAASWQAHAQINYKSLHNTKISAWNSLLVWSRVLLSELKKKEIISIRDAMV